MKITYNPMNFLANPRVYSYVTIIIIRLGFALSLLSFFLRLVAAKSLWRENLCLAEFVPSRRETVIRNLHQSEWQQ